MLRRDCSAVTPLCSAHQRLLPAIFTNQSQSVSQSRLSDNSLARQAGVLCHLGGGWGEGWPWPSNEWSSRIPLLALIRERKREAGIKWVETNIKLLIKSSPVTLGHHQQYNNIKIFCTENTEHTPTYFPSPGKHLIIMEGSLWVPCKYLPRQTHIKNPSPVIKILSTWSESHREGWRRERVVWTFCFITSFW